MRVNENISAVISNANLHRTENNLTASIERLSSGFKINHAKDNPSGMAISNKMRAQINALNQSSRNASDGISVLQTADGAMNEVHAILQRMRELSVQAATDSLTQADKQACQDEFNQLGMEIDRIAKDTEFNSKALLDGSQDRRIFPSEDGIENFHTTDAVAKGNYEFEITQLPTQASYTLGIPGPGEEVNINGYSFVTPNSADPMTRLGALRDAAETIGATCDETGKITTKNYGDRAFLDITVDGIQRCSGDLVKGKDAEIKINSTDDGFSKTASYTSDGTKIKVTDIDGFEMEFKINPEEMRPVNADGTLGDPAAPTEPVILEVTDIGTMDLQVGAHESQEIGVRIPSITTESLYIDDLNLVPRDGAARAIAALDEAIAQVSETRSRVGAYQNRLEYATASLNETEEDMEAAISRIMDTDMAQEMSEYSNQQVLDQAAISVLTQANDMPQQVLQLLQ